MASSGSISSKHEYSMSSGYRDEPSHEDSRDDEIWNLIIDNTLVEEVVESCLLDQQDLGLELL